MCMPGPHRFYFKMPGCLSHYKEIKMYVVSRLGLAGCLGRRFCQRRRLTYFVPAFGTDRRWFQIHALFTSSIVTRRMAPYISRYRGRDAEQIVFSRRHLMRQLPHSPSPSSPSWNHAVCSLFHMNLIHVVYGVRCGCGVANYPIPHLLARVFAILAALVLARIQVTWTLQNCHKFDIYW